MNFEAYLEHIPQPVVVTDKLFQVTLTNNSFRALFPRVRHGETLHAFTGSYPVLAPLLQQDEGSAQVELDERHYVVHVSFVRGKKRRQPVGRCMLFFEVTDEVRLAAEIETQSRQLMRSNIQVEQQNQLLAQRIRLDEAAAALHAQALLLRDIHDTLGHTLTVLNAHHTLALRALPNTAAARQQLDEALKLTGLSIAELEAAGALRTGSFAGFLQRFRHSMKQVGLEVELDIQGEETERHRYMYTNLMRICQEAATNSIRHGQATRLAVAYHAGPSQVFLRLKDNGSAAGPVTPGNGLSGMDERVNNLFGDFWYGPAEDGGFEIRVSAPVIRDE